MYDLATIILLSISLLPKVRAKKVSMNKDDVFRGDERYRMSSQSAVKSALVYTPVKVGSGHLYIHRIESDPRNTLWMTAIIRIH